MQPYGIHWFRRDLRLTGNLAWAHQVREHQGRVLGVFCVDPAILEREDLGPGRFGMILEALERLGDELHEAGGELLVLEGRPDVAFARLLARLGPRARPALWTWSRDYEPFAIERDHRLERWLRVEQGVEVETFRDHLIFEPAEVTKPADGTGYQVYTPFKKRWLARLVEVPERVALPPRRSRLAMRLADLGVARANLGAAELARWRSRFARDGGGPPAGHAAALKRLQAFGARGLATYARDRDIPALPGTTQMSVHLKHGAITSAEIIARLGLAPRPGKPAHKLVEQLIWREFHYHLLARRPDVERESFNPKFASLPWGNREDWFAAWCEGRTGYLIVDAAMRQLRETGWMHNRMRMVTASFLTKDLLIDYRWGERHFMKHLLDGDVAANNGGWQWAASTGCDPQPWFRVFNPSLQSRRWDPDGAYIRRWVPEAAKLGAREIHEPRDPIVDHAERKDLAIAMYRRAARAAGPVAAMARRSKKPRD